MFLLASPNRHFQVRTDSSRWPSFYVRLYPLPAMGPRPCAGFPEDEGKIQSVNTERQQGWESHQSLWWTCVDYQRIFHDVNVTTGKLRDEKKMRETAQPQVAGIHARHVFYEEKPGAFEVALTRLPPEHYREVLGLCPCKCSKQEAGESNERCRRWEANSQKDVPAKSLRTKGSSTAGSCW